MRLLFALICSLLAGPALAFNTDAVRALAFGDGEEQVAAIAALVADGDAQKKRI